MFRLPLLAAACLAAPMLKVAAFASPPPDTPVRSLTLTQALSITRQSQPALQALERELQVLDRRVRLAGQAPPVTAGLELENIAGEGERRGFRGAELTLSLSTSLELGGKAARRAEVAGSENDLRRVELAQQRRDHLADTAQHFIEAAVARARIRQAERVLKLAEATLQASQRRADAGAAPRTELQRARLRTQEARLSLRLARQSADSAARALALSMGRPDLHVRVDAQVLKLPALVSLSELLDRLDRVAAIRSGDARLRLAEAELRLARASARPDISLSGGVRRFEGSDDEVLVAGLSIPLGARERAEPERALAIGEQAAARAARQAAEYRVRALITQAWYRLTAYREEVETLRGALQAEADAVVKATAKGYRAGRYSLLQLNAAQADALQIARRSLDAAAGFHKTLIEIERLVGSRAVGESES
ncbi:MAG: hypothetical protein CMN28_02815 [Salinisphaeraceae bacterium]|nr:hypothetical protein [Salinisphaeraceae bacterium]